MMIMIIKAIFFLELVLEQGLASCFVKKLSFSLESARRCIIAIDKIFISIYGQFLTLYDDVNLELVRL